MQDDAETLLCEIVAIADAVRQHPEADHTALKLALDATLAKARRLIAESWIINPNVN